MLIKYQNKNYTFKFHKIGNVSHFESPITGEILKMQSPFCMEHYHIQLLNHIKEFVKYNQPIIYLWVVKF